MQGIHRKRLQNHLANKRKLQPEQSKQVEHQKDFS